MHTPHHALAVQCCCTFVDVLITITPCRHQMPPKREGKRKVTIVLEVHGGEELVFQFYGREGWALGHMVGSISPIQASLAERKLAKIIYGGSGRKVGSPF